jgi:hypothetical protein
MPQPTQNDVHVDAILSNMSSALLQDPNRYVASKVFAPLEVENQTDLYRTFNTGDLLRNQVQVRADGTESAGTGFNVGTATYRADVYALHIDLGDQMMANATAMDPEADAAKILTQQMLTKQETDFAAAMMATSVWDTDTDPGHDWGDGGTTSTPIETVETAKSAMLSATGYLPNVGVMTWDVFSDLKSHADIIDRYKYTSSSSIDVDMLASVFGLDEIVLMSAVQNSAVEGATDSIGAIESEKFLLLHRATSPGLMVPSAGYTFYWTGISGLGTTSTVRNIRNDLTRSNRIEIEMAWDQVVVAPELGYLLYNLGAT